ncbi:MAG: hypothetical protein QOE41_4186 [Mycobacterium sp.]|jgi:hypothetical protein|nr:hypothetical protein [Mycobacterium sp.]
MSISLAARRPGRVHHESDCRLEELRAEGLRDTDIDAYPFPTTPDHRQPIDSLCPASQVDAVLRRRPMN